MEQALLKGKLQTRWHTLRWPCFWDLPGGQATRHQHILLFVLRNHQHRGDS